MQALLDKGLTELGIQSTATQRQQWLDYVALLAKWNSTYNLTAVRDPREMVSRHILDSLSVARHIDSRTLLDVGAGPGIPSIPLAILWPDRPITALDSNGKKTRFMTQAGTALALANFTPVQSRVEAFQPEALFDGIVSRAFASLADFVTGSSHLLAPCGRLWAMKAILDPAELSAVPKPFMVSACLPLAVPGCEAERHLIVIEPSSSNTVVIEPASPGGIAQ